MDFIVRFEGKGQVVHVRPAARYTIIDNEGRSKSISLILWDSLADDATSRTYLLFDKNFLKEDERLCDRFPYNTTVNGDWLRAYIMNGDGKTIDTVYSVQKVG